MEPALEPLALGDIVQGRYRVIEPLGAGGLGAVFLCRDLRGQGGLCALKTLAPDAEGAHYLQVLRHEFEVLAGLRHPHVARVMDFGLLPGSDRPFFTEEYVRGRDIFTATEGAFPSDIVAQAVQALRGLSYLHARGFVHNDLKPENILVAEDGVVKLIDFGLTVAARSSQGDLIAGTMAFMAPEKLVGGTVDARSDLYSFGAVLYTLLARRTPFLTEDVQALFEAHLHEDPPPPSDFEPAVPPALDRVVLRLLEKVPARRFHEAGEVIEELGAALEMAFEVETRGTASGYALSVPMVGRERELQALASWWKGGDGPRTAWALIEGSAGMGRTRLLRECVVQMQLSGRRLIEVPFSEARGDWVPALWRALGELLSPSHPALAGPIAAGEEGESPGMLPRLKQALGDAARRGLGMIVVEDVQLADPDEIALLRRLIMDPEAARLRWLLSARTAPGPRGEAPAWLDDLALPGRRIRLRALSAAQVESWLRAAFGVEALAPEVVDAFLERSGGNPQLMEAIARHLLSRGAIAYLAGGWRLDGLGEALRAVPVVARDLYGQALDLLPRSALALLRHMAALNRPCGARLLDAILGDCRADLQRLMERGLLRLVPGADQARRLSHASGWARFQVATSTLRDAIYSAMPLEDRRAVHGRIAEALLAQTRRAPEGGTARDEELARQLLLAGRADEATPLARAVAEAARRDRALERSRFWFTHCLERGGWPAAEEARLRLDLGEVLSELGAQEEAAAEMRRALACLPADGASSARAAAELRSGRVWLRDTRALAEAARALEAAAALTAGAAGTPSADREVHAAAVGLLAVAALKAGDETAARARLAEAMEGWRRAGRPERGADVQMNLGVLHLRAGRAQQALPLFKSAAGAKSSHGDADGLARALQNIGWAQLVLGRPERGAEYLQQSVVAFKAARRGPAARQAMELQVIARLQSGDAAAAWRAAGEGLNECRQADDGRGAVVFDVLAGQALRELGRFERARQRHVAARAVAGRWGDPPLHRWVEAELLLDRILLDEDDASADRLESDEQGEEGGGWMPSACGLARARAAVLRGVVRPGAGVWRILDRLVAPPEFWAVRVAARLLLARAQLAAGETERAAAALEHPDLRIAEERKDWRVAALAGEIERQRGAPDRARAQYVTAMRLLWEAVSALPRADRDDALRDPDKQRLRRELMEVGGDATGG